MPPIVFIQDSEFNLQPITLNGGTVSARYALAADGTWGWSVSVVGVSGLVYSPYQNNIAVETDAEALCTAAVQGALGILSALPVAP